MFVGIAVVTAIRDQNTLVGIAFLSFSTMWCGYFTELLSRPERNQDGTYNYDKWAGDPDTGVSDYTRKRIINYLRRMFPHVMGFFPYAANWAIILNNFFEQIDDLCEGLKDRMPDFVPWIIYGSATIFSLFTFVQWRYAPALRHATPRHAAKDLPSSHPLPPPSHQRAGISGLLPNITGEARCGIAYCRCAASSKPTTHTHTHTHAAISARPCCAQATSKVFLGGILYINVLAKASFDEAVSLAGDNYTAFNITEWC
tara:strand:+ start:5981 stop:6751 length:771 start_codon:yes stop_codon:yes gene_type:complete